MGLETKLDIGLSVHYIRYVVIQNSDPRGNKEGPNRDLTTTKYKIML